MSASEHPWPTPEEIEAAQNEAGPFDRNWSRFDLSDCRHGASRVVETEEGWAEHAEHEGYGVPVFEGDVERREWEARRR